MDDFFLSSGGDPDASTRSSSAGRKRKRPAPSKAVKPPRKKKLSDDEDDDDEVGLSAIDDMNFETTRDEDEVDDDESLEKKETAAEKRLRLAKRYLQKVRDEVVDDTEVDAAAIDRDLIAERLQHDALEAAGKLFTKIAEKYADLTVDASHIRTFKCSKKKGHQLAVTTVGFAAPSPRLFSGPSKPQTAAERKKQAREQSQSTDESPLYLFSGSKDGSIIKWDFRTGRSILVIPGAPKQTQRRKAKNGESEGGKTSDHAGHSDHVLSMAVSSDGQYLATGGRDKIINIWSPVNDNRLTTFKQHRDAVSALAFRKGSNQLYSASFDRTIKLWNIDELSYVETLFGHQDQITSVDTLARERCVTAGARDRTVRLWKIVEESQLIFRAAGSGDLGETAVGADGKHKKNVHTSCGTLDVVAMVDEDTFLSGSDDGSISLWSVNRKKPLYTRLKCHGKPVASDDLSNSQSCNWITALATVPYTDLFASGSCDGQVRLWKISDSKKSFAPLTTIPMVGFVNSLIFINAPALPNESDASATTGALVNGKSKAGSSESKVLYLAVGLGQEHRLGRWWRMKKAKNEVNVVTLG
ncbi:pre-rRNA processing protein [Quaeritorhiza haematococci]|nr:pre-rRNA processing protein [Quaeritorhiza haematococci]